MLATLSPPAVSGKITSSDRTTFDSLSLLRTGYWQFQVKPEAYMKALREHRYWVERMLVAATAGGGSGNSGAGGSGESWATLENWQAAETDEDLLELAPSVFPVLARMF